MWEDLAEEKHDDSYRGSRLLVFHLQCAQATSPWRNTAGSLHLSPICLWSIRSSEGNVWLKKYHLGGWGRTILFLTGEAKHKTVYTSGLSFPKVPFTLWENHMWTSLLFGCPPFLLWSWTAKIICCSVKSCSLLYNAQSRCIIGRKYEDYSGGDNFKHICTCVATNTFISLPEIFLPFTSPHSQFHWWDHIHNSDICLSIPEILSV